MLSQQFTFLWQFSHEEQESHQETDTSDRNVRNWQEIAFRSKEVWCWEYKIFLSFHFWEIVHWINKKNTILNLKGVVSWRDVLVNPSPEFSEIRHGCDSHPVHESFVSNVIPEFVGVTYFVLLYVSGPSYSTAWNWNLASCRRVKDKGVIKNGIGDHSARIGDIAWTKLSRRIKGWYIFIKISIVNDWSAWWLGLCLVIIYTVEDEISVPVNWS